MKPYLFSVWLVLFAILVALGLSTATLAGEKSLRVIDIPQNSSTVLGIEKTNLPPISNNTTPPILTAKSVIVEDIDSGTILYQREPSIKLPIASTTKIMTALVASEYYKQNSVLVVSDSSLVEGSKVGLFRGESLTFRSLLFGMLLNSGNDAAFTIAENYPGGVLGFVLAMNRKAQDLGLLGTHFDNPAGFDSPNHYSTASDLAKITKLALKDSQLTKVFATKETQITSVDQRYHHELHNLNKLLTSVRGVLGVKTGFTEAAKENLVGLVNRGHPILTVVLGSDDRFGETTKLIDWVYTNFTWSGLNIDLQ